MFIRAKKAMADAARPLVDELRQEQVDALEY